MARDGLGAGWQCLFANDNDREKAASYAANFGREGLVVGDVARLTTADLLGAPFSPGQASPVRTSPSLVIVLDSARHARERSGRSGG